MRAWNRMRNKNSNQEYEAVGEFVRIFQRGALWHANYQFDGKQHRRSLKTASKKEAQRKARRLEAELLEGRYRDEPRAPSVEALVNEYMNFLRTERRAKKTIVKYTKVLTRLEDLTQRQRIASVDKINLRVIDAFRGERVDAGAAPKTVYNETVIIRQLINFALSRGSLSTDPLKGLKITGPKPTPQPCWLPDEVERILAASPEPQRWVFIVLADTGMRISEFAHLTWEDVDICNNVLQIRPKDDWRPKTGDMRAIPMSRRVRELVASLSRGHRWVLTAPASRRYPQGGQRVSERRLLVTLKRVLKKLGLKGHLHTFRHAFISRCLTSGIPEAVVREWVGHVDRDVIRLYTHLASTVSQDAMKRLSAGQSDKRVPNQGERASGRSGSGPNSAQTQHRRRRNRNEESAK